MFIVFGDKHRTEPVDDGLQVRRTCPKCGKEALFVERVVSKQFRLYFIEMFTHGTHHVLECTLCRTAFVTDEVKDKQVDNDQAGTIFGTLRGAASEGKRMVEGALQDGTVTRAIEEAGSQVGTAVEAGKDVLGGLLGGLRDKLRGSSGGSGDER